MEHIRTVDDHGVRYRIDLPELEVDQIVYSWPQHISAPLESQIIRLMRETTAGSPIIGFGASINDTEAAGYIKDLRENLLSGKCRLLTIRSSRGDLIGLCTLRRNLNPNNRHLADLAKGMIAERYRGRIVLSAAFYEIALQCERDGIEVLTLDVRAQTPAHHAWERFGFKTYGTLKDYARADGKSFAGHFMMQPVSELKLRALKSLQSKIASPPKPDAWQLSTQSGA